MRRNARANWILAGAVALLALAVWLQLGRERSRATDPLTAIDPAAVRRVAVDCRGCTPRRFEKIGAHWRMLEPQAQAADDAAVESLIAIARAPVRLRHAVGELDAGKVGLDPPLATLELDGLRLQFGDTDAIHGDRYVEAGGAIALVPDRFSVRLFARPENELAKPSPQKSP